METAERDEVCTEYAEWMRVVQLGLYSEGNNGEYWYPSEESGFDVSARMTELERAAIEQGLHFVLAPQGYALEPATPEEVATYKQASGH